MIDASEHKYSMFIEITKGIAIVLAMLVVLWFALSDQRKHAHEVYYDCSLASFHPDVPPRVKEACRNRSTYEQDSAEIAQQLKINKQYVKPSH